MAKPAIKYPDFADNYLPADYEIYHDVQRTTIVVNPIFVDQSYVELDETSFEKISPDLIAHSYETNAKVNEWDNIGEIDILIADALHKGIRIPEVSEVKDYLSNFPELLEILPSVCNVTREKFPSDNSQLSLEVNKDFSENNNLLILFVRQRKYDEKIMQIVDDVRSTYGERLIGKQGWLLVTTDFCSPE